MHTKRKHTARSPFDASARLPAAILTAVAVTGWFASLAPVWIAAVVLLTVLAFVSRDPDRSAVAPPRAILSPADGRIV